MSVAREPTYNFVRGVGWVPSTGPVTLIVKDTEVLVGDRLMGWTYREHYTTYEGRLVTSLSNGTINCGGHTVHVTGTISNITFTVERK